MNAVITVWILISVAHTGKWTQPAQYFGVYSTQAACEHMLSALSDPDYKLKSAKPMFMKCIAEQPQS
jgi:hypothetical protein